MKYKATIDGQYVRNEGDDYRLFKG